MTHVQLYFNLLNFFIIDILRNFFCLLIYTYLKYLIYIFFTLFVYGCFLCTHYTSYDK